MSFSLILIAYARAVSELCQSNVKTHLHLQTDNTGGGQDKYQLTDKRRSTRCKEAGLLKQYLQF